MSCNYAEGLSSYDNKGKLGLPEVFDDPQVVDEKVETLFNWLQKSEHTVFFTGAGISTAAGIPDFRGPKGVWTLEKKGLKPEINVSWDDAKPTLSHMAIYGLVQKEKAQFVISQNLDGLHLRSGLPRNKLAELHGNMFVDNCSECRQMKVRSTATTSVGQKLTGKICERQKPNGRICRGKLKDFVLDWEDELPKEDLELSDSHSMLSKLSIVIGSTLQIIPAGTMPTLTKKYHGNHGKLVIINLQPTKQDAKADLIIRAKSDVVMSKLFEKLGEEIPKYDSERDPINQSKLVEVLDWTQTNLEVKCWGVKAASLLNTFKAEKKKVWAAKSQDVDEKMELVVPLKKVKDEKNHHSDFETICVQEIKEEVDEKPKILP